MAENTNNPYDINGANFEPDLYIAKLTKVFIYEFMNLISNWLSFKLFIGLSVETNNGP